MSNSKATGTTIKARYVTFKGYEIMGVTAIAEYALMSRRRFQDLLYRFIEMYPDMQYEQILRMCVTVGRRYKGSITCPKAMDDLAKEIKTTRPHVRTKGTGKAARAELLPNIYRLALGLKQLPEDPMTAEEYQRINV